jgi:hypothetical protein
MDSSAFADTRSTATTGAWPSPSSSRPSAPRQGAQLLGSIIRDRGPIAAPPEIAVLRLTTAQLAEVSGVGDKDEVQEALKRGAETAQTLS